MNTIEGGIYKDANGEGYHDANGKPVDKSKVAEAEKLQREYVAQFAGPVVPTPVDSVQALANTLANAVGLRAQPQAQEPTGNVAANESVTSADRLADETERRAKKG